MNKQLEFRLFSFPGSSISRIPRLRLFGGHGKEKLRNCQIACRAYAYQHGIDSPEIAGWRWPQQ